ncbi:MAG: M3 family oligoendopeptidase [Candidatus Paceibacterota bacterium]
MLQKKIKNVWDLSPLFNNDNDPLIIKERKKVARATSLFVKKWKDKKNYLEQAKVLKQVLNDYENWARFFGANSKELDYFHYRNSQDQSNHLIKARLNQAFEFAQKIGNEMEFFYLSLGRITKEKQQEFLKSKELAPYRHYLKKIFDGSRYFLTEPEEKIINLKHQTSHSNWVMMTSLFISKESRKILDEDGKRKPKFFEEIMTLISSKKKSVRDEAAQALNDILAKNSEIAEHEINSVLQNKKINDQIRGFDRPDKARHLSDDIETKIVDTLCDVVKKRFDLSRRYYKLKAKLMKVKRLKYHERNVEYGKKEKKYSYNQSVQLVRKVFFQLDKEFGEIFDSFLNNGQIDVFPRQGKTGGAYCSHGLIIQPTYILLNHTNKLRDVLTIAHEVGHGINNELMKKRENALNFGNSLAVAETASTFMEDFVLEELLKQADEELRLEIITQRLGDIISTIQRQIACYNFEKDLHQNFREKGYLSKEEIGRIFQKNMSAYMGDAVEQSPGSENWWVYWSHIRSFFYVYSYASGLLISKSLQKTVKQNPEFIKKVKEILSIGLSESPQNIFLRAGIDITKKSFWEKGLKEIEEQLIEAERLAKKIGK